MIWIMSPISAQNYDELVARMDEYMEEFEQNWHGSVAVGKMYSAKRMESKL